MRAIALLTTTRVQLVTSGFPRLMAALEQAPVGHRRDDAFPAAVRRAVSRASRTVPGSRCLAQAITAYRLLCLGGHPAELTLGVRKDATGPDAFGAHAWVYSAGRLVTGDGPDIDLSRYTPLTHVRTGG